MESDAFCQYTGCPIKEKVFIDLCRWPAGKGRTKKSDSVPLVCSAHCTWQNPKAPGVCALVLTLRVGKRRAIIGPEVCLECAVCQPRNCRQTHSWMLN